MWNGFSSHPLVLPNIMEVASEGTTSSEVFEKRLNILHDAHKAFIQTKANERI